MNTAYARKKYYPHDLTHERPNFQMFNSNVFQVILHMAVCNANANAITCSMSDCARGHNARVHMRPINTSEQAGGRAGRVGQSKAGNWSRAEENRARNRTELNRSQ